MRLNLIAAAALLAAAPAFAAIAPGTTGNGELVLVVADSTAKVSFAFDTGVLMNDFVLNANVKGTNLSWADTSADPSWASFMSASTGHALTWAVFADDSTGANSLVGGQRLLATVRSSQENLAGTMTNAQFSLGTGATQMGVFFGAVNATGTQNASGASNYVANGSSFNADPSNAYFGRAGVTSSTLNGNSPFNITNAVVLGGKSTAPFYYFTRSGSTQGATVIDTKFAAPMTLTVSATGSNFLLGYTVPVPEPEAFSLMAAGLATLAFVGRRRKQAV
jgi:hypothetical protein